MAHVDPSGFFDHLASPRRAQRLGMFRDAVSALMLFLLICCVLGLIVRWHVFSVLISVPFFVAWRHAFWKQMRASCRQRSRADHYGIGVCALVFAYCAVIVSLVIAGVLPASNT